jgi:hypothetical protein
MLVNSRYIAERDQRAVNNNENQCSFVIIIVCQLFFTHGEF